MTPTSGVGRTWARLADLPLVIDEYALEGLELDFDSGTAGPVRDGAPPVRGNADENREPSSDDPADEDEGFRRLATLVHLRGAGAEGVGEDPTYSAADQLAFLEAGTALPLSGATTLGGFSARLDDLDLFPRPPEYAGSEDYRRWAFESAALDLALRQAGTSLAGLLDIEPRPLRFVASQGLSTPEQLARLRELRGLYPDLGLKLDADPSWDDDLIAELAGFTVRRPVTDASHGSAGEEGRGSTVPAVAVVDFKGAYVGTPVDQPADADLYRRVVEGLPDAWIEDPDLDDAARAVLRPYMDRVTWDAPIHSIADLDRLEQTPRMINLKPSRFGSLQRLFDALDHCRDEGIGIYGGGQLEIGPGRGQVQMLASLFYPDSPNDVAPTAYNATRLSSGLPLPPLRPPASRPGFRWSR